MTLPSPIVPGKPIDRRARGVTLLLVKTQRSRSNLARLDLNQADQEVASLKRQFREEDQVLVRQGRQGEIASRNRRLMGLRDGAKTRLVGFGGVRFE